MNMYLKLWLGILAVVYFVSLMSTFVSAAECNADLSQGGDSCTVSSSLTLNGTYNIQVNGTTGGYIILNANNVIFDGNGTIFTGNTTAGLILVYSSHRANNTIRNFTAINYARALTLYSPTNSLIEDIKITNESNNGLYIAYSSDKNASNITIRNSIFNTSQILSLGQLAINGDATHSNSNFLIYNNSFFGNNATAIYTTHNNNISVTSNNYIGNFQIIDSSFNNLLIWYDDIVNNVDWISQTNDHYMFSSLMDSNAFVNRINATNGNIRFYFENSTNLKFTNNYIYNQSFYGTKFLRVDNGNISYNIFDLNTYGSFLIGCTNTIYSYNTINNSRTNANSWNTGLIVRGKIITESGVCQNISILNNSITNFGVGGIYIQHCDNISISKNYVNPFSINQMISNSIKNTAREPIFDIGILEIQQTWTDDGEGDAGTVINYTNITNYKSFNIQINGNVFGSNSQAYIYSQETINLTHDLSTFWFRSFQFPSFFVGRTDLWMNNAFNNMSYVNKSSNYNEELFQGLKVHSSQYDSGYFLGSYKVNKDYMYFKNTDFSLSTYPELIGNFSSYPFIVLVYNLTSALLTNGTGICNGSSSNLALNTGQVNITLQPNEECWVYDSFNPSDITRLESQFTIPQIRIIYASAGYNYDYYTVESGCTSTTKTGFGLVMILSSLILPIVIIIYLRSKDWMLDMNDLILIFMTLIICLALWQVAGQNLGSACGVVS